MIFFKYKLKIFYLICCSLKRSAVASTRYMFYLYNNNLLVCGSRVERRRRQRSVRLQAPRLWVPFLLGEICFFFSFLRTGNKAKCGVEFRHPTCNASRILRKVGTKVLRRKEVLTLGSEVPSAYIS